VPQEASEGAEAEGEEAGGDASRPAKKRKRRGEADDPAEAPL